jgi:gluconokinase
MFKGTAIVMGVTSCGKTSVGEALAAQLNCLFIEGDKLHPPANIAKMSTGQPLNDDDRWPWLAAIGEAMRAERERGNGVIASCSSLKRIYRQKLAEAAETPIQFIFLYGSEEVLAARIARRKGHFMPPSLLGSQLKTLEVPGPDEAALHLNVALPVVELVKRAKDYLLESKHG